jgi:lysophospholipase
VLKVENEFPEVRLGGPTRRWVAEACFASDTLLAETSKVVTPVLVLQASEDTAVMPGAQAKFCSELARTTGRPCEGGGPQIIHGGRHELLIEADRYRVPAMSKIFEFYAKSLAAN